MEYKCRTVSLTKVIPSVDGFMEPLCNSCSCEDCSNRIEKNNIAVLGISQPWRLLMRGSDPCVVIDCEGYVK